MTIREATPADASGIARVHVDSWRSTYRGIVPDDFLASLSYEARETMWAGALATPDNPSFIYVAEDEAGQVVGFACAGPPRPRHPMFSGELYAIYILQEHQGKGIGRRLVQAAAGQLLERGITSMMLWVFADNHRARRFYEALGGEAAGEQQFELGGVPLTEAAYGWKDLDALVRSLEQR